MENQDFLQSSETKGCPFCAETINVNAKKCKHCGEFLEAQNGIIQRQTVVNSHTNQILLKGGCILLISALFLPWFDYLFKISPVTILIELSKMSNSHNGSWGNPLGKDSGIIILGIFSLFVPSICGAIGIISILNSGKDTKNTLQMVSKIALITILLIFLFLTFKMNEGSRGGVNPFAILGSGWYIALVGSILMSLGTYKRYFENESITIQPTPYIAPQLTAEDEIRKTEREAKREAERNARLAEIRAKQDEFEKKFRKYAPKVLASGLGIAGLIWGIVFIVTPNPEKEGVKAAKVKCQCEDTEQGNIVNNLKTVITTIDNNGFKRKSEARDKKDAINNFSEKYQYCFAPTYEELKNKFSDNYFKKQKFEMAFENYMCNNANQQLLNTTLQQLDSKIASIKDSEPDSSDVKSDLIHQDLYRGFSLNSTYDVMDFKIVKTIRSQGRISFDYITTTKGFQEANKSVWKGNITYVDIESSWFRESITTKGLNLFYEVTPNAWKPIPTIPDAKFSISDDSRISLTTDDFWVTNKYDIGPDVPNITLPPSNAGKYSFISRESNNVFVEFIYNFQ